MQKNKEEFQKYKKELESYLFPEEKNINEIDENELKKTLYKLLKSCLLTREYIINIGNYEINMTPQNLGIKYSTEGTYFEISNDDFYERTERNTETRFFVISDDKDKEFYSVDDVSYIETEGVVLNNNGNVHEHYYLELTSKDENLKIQDLINLKNGMTLKEDSPNSVFLVKPVKKEDERTDIYDYLDINRIQPVYYYEKEEKFVPQRKSRKEYNPNNYSELIPDLSNRRRLCRAIYGYMVDYYTRYMMENKF